MLRSSIGPLALLPFVLVAATAVHCGGSTNGDSPLDGGASVDSGIGDDGGTSSEAGSSNPDAVGAKTSSKVDVLLVVDNSASMADKAKLLAGSVGTLLQRVAVAGDVHVGVITSSLGTMGGNICPDSGATNTLAHLSTMGAGGTPVAGAASGFLSFGGGGATDVGAFVADAASLVQGVGENGCGLEAQLESAYRFLVQPDPWMSVTVDANNQAQYVGLDATLLTQRKAFLRPDSLVVVVLLTDEDDSSADPRSLGGQGWAFMNTQFPGSTTFRSDGRSTTAPRPTSACASDPGSQDCTSCAFAATCNATDASCQKIKNDPECLKNGGYYGPTEDPLNARFQRMKQRFGIDPQFPLSRYVDGFTKQRAPKRADEHAQSGTGIAPYSNAARCTNPLFAMNLPSASGDELCALPQGPRGKELVVFAVIGGVPEGLATTTPDWTKILGANPDTYDATGIDPHMIQSITPRAGLTPPSTTRGDNGNDPVNGREWDTKGNDLQFACTFALPTPRSCTAADQSCDCAQADLNPPLCSSTAGQQTRGKAYPTTRELSVVKALGDRGIAGSICPTNAATGFDGTMTTLADRLASRLAK